jgi:hypothetical protein
MSSGSICGAWAVSVAVTLPLLSEFTSKPPSVVPRAPY